MEIQVVVAVGHKVPSEVLISLCPHQHPQSASLHDDDVEYSSAGVPLVSPPFQSACILCSATPLA